MCISSQSLRTRCRQVPPTNEGTQLHFFAIVTAEYILHPLSLIIIFLAGEGALRAWSVLFIEEVIPSFPMKLAAVIRDRRREEKEEAALGPAIPDIFESCEEGQTLRISSQRPKEGWRIASTIAVGESFYTVVHVECCTGERRVTYALRKLSAGQIIRGLYRYEPPGQ